MVQLQLKQVTETTNIVGSNTTNAGCVDISNEIEIQCNGMLINICPDQKLYGQDNQSLYINLRGRLERQAFDWPAALSCDPTSSDIPI